MSRKTILLTLLACVAALTALHGCGSDDAASANKFTIVGSGS